METNQTTARTNDNLSPDQRIDAILNAVTSRLDTIAFAFDASWETSAADRLASLRRSTAGRNLHMLCRIIEGSKCDPEEYVDLVTEVSSAFDWVQCDELSELLDTAKAVLSELMSQPLGTVPLPEAVAVVRRSLS